MGHLKLLKKIADANPRLENSPEPQPLSLV
jgi:hypothetical protein